MTMNVKLYARMEGYSAFTSFEDLSLVLIFKLIRLYSDLAT